MTKRRKYIQLPTSEQLYALVGRLGIGDPVVLQCEDIEVTVTVMKLEKAAGK